MKKLSMFLVVGMGLYGSLLIACGDDDDEVTCADDAECAAKCTEGDAATCVDGVCDGCTLPTVDCTADGTECADNCEEGADATCNADTLTCDGCTPKGGDTGDDDDDVVGGGCATDEDCEEGMTCTIAEGETEGTCGEPAAEDCSTMEEGAACMDGAGECKDGKCMASSTVDVELAWAGATGGDCLTWADGAPAKDTYKYDGNTMDNDTCILGINNGGLWWAGAAAGGLKVDSKSIDVDATKLAAGTEATDGDHVAEWGGEEYNFTSSNGDKKTTLTFTTWSEVGAAE